MASNTSTCSATSGISILPSTNTTVCGIRSLQVNLAPCCGDAEVQTYQCQQYCNYGFEIAGWHKCLTDNTNTSAIADAFCQSHISGNTTETLATSFGSSSPRASFLLVLLALSALLFTSVDAITVPSLANSIDRRQSTQASTCMLEISSNYTTLRNNTISLTADMGCKSDFCETGAEMDTGILNNNRTINGVSAADAKYDVFFDLVHNKTGHWFPALSKSMFHYSYLAPAGLHRVIFTPFAWCIDGMATGCGDSLSSNAATSVTVCGPDFVEDPTAATLSSASIQGALAVLKLHP